MEIHTYDLQKKSGTNNMIKTNLRFALSAISFFSILLAATAGGNAAPVRFRHVKQVVNAKPGKANSQSYTSLRLTSDPVSVQEDDDDDNTQNPRQDDPVVTETGQETFEEFSCPNCQPPPPPTKCCTFPSWKFLGLAGIAAVTAIVLLWDDDDDDDDRGQKKRRKRRGHDPPPTPTKTHTPTEDHTPTETHTPTPTTEPVPEPVTIILFGTGLAGVGLAARKRFGRREDEDEE